MLLQPKRNFLKVDLVKDGDTLEFLNEGEWVDSKWTYDDGTPKQQFIMSIKHKGIEYDFTVNVTSRNQLMEAFGRETGEWIGKKAIIELVKQNIGGELKNVIYLTPMVENG